MSSDKIGVYVCQCGGNIGDYVDVNEVVAAVEKEQGVTVAKTAMFTCSDATQTEIIDDAREQGLDGLVIASCSPKLHTFTFRDVAKRAGMNPFQYTQVNVREQCSWTHTDDHEGATEKAVRLVRAGINRTRLTDPLEPIVVETTPKSLVVGGGIAGLRAALGLAEVGLSVFLVEKEAKLGGWVAGFREMYPHGRNGRELINEARGEGALAPGDHRVHQAELIAKSGSFGNYQATVAVKNGEDLETITVDVGSIVIATGFDTYKPGDGELGYGIDGVVTIADFKKLLDETDGPLVVQRQARQDGRLHLLRRQPPGREHRGRQHLLLALLLHGRRARRDPGRGPARRACTSTTSTATCGPTGSTSCCTPRRREKGSAFVKFPDDEPPAVEKDAKRRRHRDGQGPPVRRRGGRAHRRPRRPGHRHGAARERGPHQGAQAPRRSDRLLQRDPPQAPAGRDGRGRRLHLRRLPERQDLVRVGGLRPRRGDAERGHPQARLRRARPAGRDGRRRTPAPGAAPARPPVPTTPSPRSSEGGKEIAAISKTACKGCGGCVPVCPSDAIDLQGYTDAQIRSMIDGMLEVVCHEHATNRPAPRLRPVREVIRDEHSMRAPILRGARRRPADHPPDRRGGRQADARGHDVGHGPA